MINWNPFNLEKGERVILDKEFNNSSEVTVKSFSTNKMFTKVLSDDGDEWDTMTNRLTPITQ